MDEQPTLLADEPEPLSLYPPEAPRGDLVRLELKELPAYPDTAPGWLLQSIKRRGVMQPLVVADHGDEGYVVMDGKRRLDAARRAGLVSIAAHVYDSSDLKVAGAITLSLNNQRANNPVREFEAIVDLALAKGFGIDEIAKATGLTRPAVKAALQLTALAPALLEAMKDGRLTYSVARRIAQLSRAAQAELIVILEEKKGLTAKDVKPFWVAESKQVKTGSILAGDPIHEWTSGAVEIVNQLIKEAPAGAPSSALYDLKSAADALEGAKDELRDQVVEFKAGTAQEAA